MDIQGKCPICDSNCSQYPYHEKNLIFYNCPVCGRYQSGSFYCKSDTYININYLAPYLCHNRYVNSKSERRYHTTMDRQTCNQYRKEYENGNTTLGLPVHMDQDIVENWYPKTFAERVDYILLYLNAHSRHIGQRISLSYQEALSAFFIDRREPEGNYCDLNCSPRDPDECEHELRYMLDYFLKKAYIKYTQVSSEEEWVDISLAPEGYTRVDALQKNISSSRNVLVAMKFGDDTRTLREAIRKGISKAGYIAIFIDEVQHNDFITPELLKYIHDSKFVVCDLTHQNNGAYFEEGYAMGLGKPVIQLCKKGTMLHFDIAQKNTIIWSSEDEIAERLMNRIRATID